MFSAPIIYQTLYYGIRIQRKKASRKSQSIHGLIQINKGKKTPQYEKGHKWSMYKVLENTDKRAINTVKE